MAAHNLNSKLYLRTVHKPFWSHRGNSFRFMINIPSVQYTIHLSGRNVRIKQLPIKFILLSMSDTHLKLLHFTSIGSYLKSFGWIHVPWKPYLCYSVLGSRRAVPVTGRKVNMITDILRLIDPSIQRTIFISPAHNLCFYGYFRQYSDSYHPICGVKEMLEVMRWLNSKCISAYPIFFLSFFQVFIVCIVSGISRLQPSRK